MVFYGKLVRGRENMKRLWMLFILSFLLLVVTACGYSQEPEITIEAVVAQLSEEEFDYAGTHGLDNPTRDDFRKITIDFEVEHAAKTTRNVEFPKGDSWREALDTVDNNKRYWSGKSYKQNNDSENFARYEKEVVFYSKGLNEDEIRKIFNSINFELYLDAEEGESMAREYKVGDLIKFDNNGSS